MFILFGATEKCGERARMARHNNNMASDGNDFHVRSTRHGTVAMKAEGRNHDDLKA